MADFIFLILGIAGLLFGAHLVIKGSLNIAEHYKISQSFIGLTIVAMGTSLPELVTAVVGSIRNMGGTDVSGIIIGEILGSCMGNLGLILGAVAMFGAVSMTGRELKRDGVMLIISVLIFFLLGLDGTIDRLDGILFLLVFLLFFLSVYREEKVFEKFQLAPKLRMEKVAMFLIAGFVILIFSSNLVLEKSVEIARAWGIRQSIVGIFIIGLGTSLPEVVVSLGALRKKAYGLSVGNLFGSNVFNLMAILGTSSAVYRISVRNILIAFDTPFLFLVSIATVVLFWRKLKIGKAGALLLISLFLAYLILKLTFFA